MSMSTRKAQNKNAWLKLLVSNNKQQILIALSLGVLTFGCAVLLMFTSGYLISKTAVATTTLFAVMVPIACVQLFGLGRPVARYFERLTSHDWVFKATSRLRLALFQAARKQAANNDMNSVGSYLSVLGDDVAHLQNLFLRVVFPSVVALLLWFCACIVCGWFSWALLLIMFCYGAICIFVLPSCALLLSRSIIHKAQKQQTEEYEKLTDDILGSVDIRLAGRSKEAIVKHEQVLNELDKTRSHIRFYNRVLELISALLMVVACVFMLFATSSVWGGTPEMQNWIAAFALGLFPLLEVFVVLPAASSEITKHQGAIENLNEFLFDSKSSASQDHYESNIEARPVASIEIKGLSFTYSGAAVPVLKNIDLTIKPGSKVALIGRSGSGKSTLLNIIDGQLKPTDGKLSFASGSCTGEVASLNQSPYIFDRSLKENLSLANPHATEESMIEMLIKSGLKDKFDSLHNGLATHIGETGEGFSGGEAHRIALARTLLAQPNVLLLDEPFNALDPKTESSLIQVVFENSSNCTLIVATHHLAEIDRFDRVLIMNEGSIVLDGSPEELLESSQEFRDLVAFDH